MSGRRDEVDRRIADREPVTVVQQDVRLKRFDVLIKPQFLRPSQIERPVCVVAVRCAKVRLCTRQLRQRAYPPQWS